MSLKDSSSLERFRVPGLDILAPVLLAQPFHQYYEERSASHHRRCCRFFCIQQCRSLDPAATQIFPYSVRPVLLVVLRGCAILRVHQQQGHTLESHSTIWPTSRIFVYVALHISRHDYIASLIQADPQATAGWRKHMHNY